jgi:hypothetical protein
MAEPRMGSWHVAVAPEAIEEIPTSWSFTEERVSELLAPDASAA